MVVGGTSTIPFAERKFIWNKQENQIKSMGYGVYQTPIIDKGRRKYGRKYRFC